MVERKVIPLRGSERRPVPGARKLGAANPDERFEITVVLRRPGPAPEIATPGARAARPAHIARATFAERYGALPDDVARIRAFAAEHGLEVTRVNVAARTVRISGTVAQFSATFRTTLDLFEHKERVFRGRTGPLHIPADLEGVVEAVLGLDNRPQAEPHFVRQAGSGSAAFSPVQIAGMYGFPPLDGSGQTIGIIELGGGFARADLNTFFHNLGLSTSSVVAVGVDGGTNSVDGDPNSADGEVMLDIEVAGAVAPAAYIRVYFAPNSDDGFLDAIGAAVHDDVEQPSVISISWGASESAWTSQSMSAMNSAFEDAAALGVTICVASGDDGSNDRVGDGHAHADFPASSPFVLGCGGTTLTSSDGVFVTNETVWNNSGSTGGGVSETFARPAYQAGAGVPASVNAGHFVGRGVPDVAGDADPATGYQIRVDGTDAVFGGTSAVAPLWAGLIALANQFLGPPTVGFLNPLLYADTGMQRSFSDITVGNNGVFSARSGWDACTGWGSPNGAGLLGVLALWRFVQMDQQ
jgi:kumamolisin